jgi:hypothetical protein
VVETVTRGDTMGAAAWGAPEILAEQERVVSAIDSSTRRRVRAREQPILAERARLIGLDDLSA